MIKAILFDNFGVLMDAIYEPLLQAAPEGLAEKLAQINDQADRGEISETTRNREWDELIQPGAVARNRAASRKNVPLFSLIAQLRAAGFKTGLLSNASHGLLEQLYMQAELEQYFDDVVISADVHLVKPDAAVYQLAATRLHVQPAECIFTDDRAAYIAGAERVGMHGILYQNFAQFQIDLVELLQRENAVDLTEILAASAAERD
jgi:HAD superfamily hydrolase (TIGR01509 family)